jgi:ribulose-phosphate 3-epimerase
MSVHPGFGGQSFIESSKKKIEQLNALRQQRSFLISVDGGLHAGNVHELRSLGADVFVVGSAVFSHADRRSAIAKLRAAL